MSAYKTVALLCFLNFFATQSETALAQDDASARFQAFLQREITKFPSWALENGLEPLVISDPITLKDWTYLLRYQNKLVSQTIHGLYSNMVGFYVLALFEEGEGSLNRKFLEISWTSHDLHLSGQYEISGSLFKSLPLQGQGSFHYVPVENTDNKTFTAYINHYGFSSLKVIDDHISLDHSVSDVGCSYLGWLGLDFEGLNATGHENTLTGLMEQEYDDKSHCWLPFIIQGHLKAFLDKVFAEHPFSEIVGEENAKRFSFKKDEINVKANAEALPRLCHGEGLAGSEKKMGRIQGGWYGSCWRS